MTENPNAGFGEIVGFLIKESYITEDQAVYAKRVQRKLTTQRTMLDVLKELNFVSEDNIRQAIRKNHVSMRIGDLLVEIGLLNKEKLQAAFDIQKSEGKGQKIGEILVDQKFITKKKLFETLSLQLGYGFVDPEYLFVDADLFSIGNPKWYKSHNFIPLKKEGNKVLIAFSDPLDHKDFKGAVDIFGPEIQPAIAARDAIIRAIDKNSVEQHALDDVLDNSSVVGVANSILVAAADEGASDIHIEPLSDRLQVRFRQDGILVHYKDFPRELSLPLTSRFKILSGNDISEKRRHQGGRLSYECKGQELDLRASYYVTVYGEKIVLRILNNLNKLIPVEKIGMLPKMLKRFLTDALDIPSGVMLVTGPTGSGKTSTVYSCVNYLNSPSVNIVTAEEPVEYIVDGISQCSINPKINLTFEETLRHIVRQDPDVIVIGEIRDNYSADVAVNAALTGQKVLTTFHTEDSIGGLIRLMNMDIESFLISSTVVCVLAQRLLRRVCPECGVPSKPAPDELRRIGYTTKDVLKSNFKKGPGCSHCRHTGYKGRIGIFEMLVLNEQVRDAILNNKSSFYIRNLSIETSGLVTLLEDAMLKASFGETTLEEVFRCIPRLIHPRPLDEIRRLLGATS